MLSVVIPVKDLHEVTMECIENLTMHAAGDLDIIVIDNNSEVPVERVINNVRVIRNNQNAGFWPSMLQGIEAAESSYVLMMHNDVLIWEQDFDKRIIEEFMLDDKLGAVGLFGGRGVDVEGGRGYPEGNMKGKKYGTSQGHHGYVLEDEHPAVVFDSLAICLNKHTLKDIDPLTIPPHHWTDRLLCLRLIKAGYHCLTVGIAFDHGSGFTSTTSTMNNFSEEWCKSKGLELEVTWEATLYNYGKNIFATELQQMISPFSQLWVDREYNYYAR